MTNRIEIDVWQGDIAQLEMDAIVVPANESLFMTSDVAAAVKRVAGEGVEVEASAQGPLPAGSVAVTSGGALATPYILHAVAVGHGLRGDPDVVRRAIDASLERAELLGIRRLALPLLGTERGVMPADVAAATLVAALEDHAARATRTLQMAVIVAASRSEFAAIAQALGAGRSGVP